MRKLTCWLIANLFLFALCFGQESEITGRVTDSLGLPISNASIKVINSKRGTTSDNNGYFKLKTTPGTRLQISSVGYDPQEFIAAPDLTARLSIKSNSLNEVVVTALGIRREKKALGYAVSTIGKKELEQRPEGDIARVLNGKAPGVNILNTSGLSGSGTNIIIRGVSSITGSATPLFVVDGVPFDAGTNAQSDFRFANQTSSRFLDIDPNSIESIDVLKGLSATTLYGEYGRNGVVLITTKNGANRRVNKKAEITVDQSFFINNVANLPDYQDSWGGGIDNVATPAFSNFGAKITDPVTQIPHLYDRADVTAVFPEFRGALYDYKPYNSVENFYRTGVISSTSVNLAGSGNNTGYNMNYGYLSDEGFTPGNKLIRNTFGLGGNAKLSNNITASATFNYTINDFKSPPTGYSSGSGAVNGPSAFGDLFYTPRTVDLMGLPYQNPVTGGAIYYRADNAIQNPRWTVDNSFVRQQVNRIFGNAQLRYAIVKGLNLTYRLGYDKYTEDHMQAQNKGGSDGNVNGFYRTVRGVNNIWDHTLIANYNKSLNNDWSLSVDAGVNSREDQYEQSGINSTQQLVFGLLDHSNFTSKSSVGDNNVDLDYIEKQQNIGVFAQTQINYKDWLFMNVGARNSWTTALEKGNNSLLYPSISVSFIPTSAISPLSTSKTINYLKFRAGYSTSASFPDPYTTRPVLDILSSQFVTANGTVVNSNRLNRRAPNPDLVPELISEIEVGMEVKFINNRASIDLTLYNRSSKDQILDQDLDPATGFDIKTINAGKLRNKGIELALGYTVVKSKNITWQLDGNFTLNRSKVSDMPDEITQIVLAGFSNRGTIAQNGQPLGVLYGTYIPREAKTGEWTVNQATGYYLVSPDSKIIGDPNPDYRIVGISTLSFKGLSFRMQWDYTKGGDMYAVTPQILVARGVTKDTDFDRSLPFIYPGVDENGIKNQFQISSSTAFFDGSLNADEQYIFDATVVRLRELSLSYSLPQTLLQNLPFGNVSLTVSGTNLFYKAPYFPEYTRFDPETSSLGVSSSRGFEYATAPSSRRIGASLRFTF
ncbi:MAG: SusC/RagA family TonB-linked outer membrane protein [Chitinophagaceae bacterium]|nr:SusC/RagA family TonB-linked outer membrane protein [Chitinophagaceae bacterium]